MGFSAAILCSQIVLFLWIYVMYNGNKAVTSFLGLLFVACAAATYTMLALSFRDLEIRGELIPRHPFCGMLNPPSLLVYFWTPILAYSSVVLLLIGYKGYQLLSSPHARARNPALTDVYIKSTTNFVIMFSSYLLCTIFWLAAQFALAQVPMVLALSLSITNASNLLLHIRQAYYSPRSLEEEAQSISSVTGSKTIYVDSRSAGSAEWMYELRELKWKRR
ncbi:hypothetical protein PM082_001462 [Marasmius tenuissimus]|nr:hypothetical protein PM082_001462 [Marasmius tenuissimus]